MRPIPRACYYPTSGLFTFRASQKSSHHSSRHRRSHHRPRHRPAPRETDAVIQDGWFRTGDIGYMDEVGFLFIEGRVSRFSKIGGEMVPHEKIEDEINKVFGVDAEDQRHFAIVGVPDDAKGEALVLISKTLWIPKRVVHVEEIPVLASGKLDIKACENAANSQGI